MVSGYFHLKTDLLMKEGQKVVRLRCELMHCFLCPRFIQEHECYTRYLSERGSRDYGRIQNLIVSVSVYAWATLWHMYGPYTTKHLQGKILVVFHSIKNLFLQIMALTIGNISLQNAIANVLPRIAIFY